MKSTARMALIVAVILIGTSLAFPNPAGAGSFSNYEKALDLKILGLLTTPAEGFELERTPSRTECAVMLARLLGKESRANQGKYAHPFTDVPAAADPYIGYLYQNGFDMGIGGSEFGPDVPLSAGEYVTFVLRLLGYGKTDFSPGQALDRAVQAGVLSGPEAAALKESVSFSRNDFVGISYNALTARMKSTDRTLLDKLALTDKVLFKPAVKLLGLYTSDIKPDYAGIGAFHPQVTASGSVAKGRNDLFYLLRDAIYGYRSSLKIDVSSYSGDIAVDFKDAFAKAVQVVSEVTGVEYLVSSWEYTTNSKTLTLSLTYPYSKANYLQRQSKSKEALDKAKRIAASLIGPGMSDYAKEKALHDYIINNTQFDYRDSAKGKISDDSYSAYGCLVLGLSVCEGYSEAMKLLCDLSSLECMVITGESKENNTWQGHAWNLVKVDGEYYHLDVSGDDPVVKGGGNLLTYSYFNLPDSEMALSSRWNRKLYPKCTSLKNNYYYKNSMVAESKSAFDKALQASLRQKKPMIELKVYDYSDARYSNISAVIFGTNVVRKYNAIINEEQGIIRIYNIKYS